MDRLGKIEPRDEKAGAFIMAYAKHMPEVGRFGRFERLYKHYG